MKKLLQTYRWNLIIAICSILFTGCASTHTVEAYFGKVVDSDTKKPLEGAVILTIYSLYMHSDIKSRSDTAYYSTIKPLAAQETITDENGEFKIKSIDITHRNILKERFPLTQFVIFKPGYGNYPANHTIYVHYPEYHGPKGSNKAYVQRSSGYIPPGKYVTIELPLLSSKQARALNIPAINFKIPYEKQRNFLSAISKELYLLNLPQFYSNHYFMSEFNDAINW